MTDFSTDATGAATIYKRCVDNDTCNTQWFHDTSDVGACLVGGTGGFDPSRPNVTCHWCCVQDGCNVGIQPAPATLANWDLATGVCTPG
jgi:hypothetical protein